MKREHYTVKSGKKKNKKQEGITIINVYMPNNKASKYTRPTLTGM